jgi:NADH:ubiquinone oxidoreductase subunit C
VTPDPGTAADPLLYELRQELGDALVAQGPGAGVTIEVRPDDIVTVATLLRTRFRYTLLVDLCAADYPCRQPRFEVIYHLYSFRENRRLRVKVLCDASSPVPSVAAVWRSADWLEREAHDLFGIAFSGRAALLPLRKDFPLAGIATGAGLPGILAAPPLAAPLSAPPPSTEPLPVPQLSPPDPPGDAPA